MPSNLDRYKQDLDVLIKKGDHLHIAIQAESLPNFADEVRKQHGEVTEPTSKPSSTH